MWISSCPLKDFSWLLIKWRHMCLPNVQTFCQRVIYTSFNCDHKQLQAKWIITHHQTELQQPSWPDDLRAPWHQPGPGANHVTARSPECASVCPPTEAPRSRGEGRNWGIKKKQTVLDTVRRKEWLLLKNGGKLTSCHSLEASCPTCNMSQVALWKALCEDCGHERDHLYIKYLKTWLALNNKRIRYMQLPTSERSLLRQPCW